MKKLIALALIALAIASHNAFGQTMLNVNRYFSYFSIKKEEDIADSDYVWEAKPEDMAKFGNLAGTVLPDTPLEFALLSYYSQPVLNIRPAEADAILPKNNPKLADQKLGAAVFQEIQVLRFLGDTAAVSRHEAMLKWITDRKNATRAEIEAFYRDNIRELVTNAVDEGMQKTTSVSSAIKSEFKQAIINFYVSPSQTTFRTLNQFLIVKANEAERQIRDRASKSTNAFVKSAVDFDIQMEKLDLKMLVMYVELQLPGIIKLVESP